MEKLHKSTKRKNRIKKIIFSSAMVITMAVFFISGFSADEVVYLNYNFDPFQFVQNSNSKATYGYNNNSGMTISIFSNTSPASPLVSDLPYSSFGYSDLSFGSYWFDGVIYHNGGQITNNRMLVSFDLGFDYYFDDFSIDLYFLFPNSYCTYSGFYLNEDDQIVNFNISSDIIYSGLYNNIPSQYLSSLFNNYLASYTYFTGYDGSTNNTAYRSYTMYLYKLSISLSNLNKERINSFNISINYNVNNGGTNGPRLCPYFFFGHQTVYGFIKSSQDQVYTQQLAYQSQLVQQQQQIIQQNQQIIDNQEIIVGDPSFENQDTLDDLQDDFEHKQAQLQEDIDIIHSVEFPTEEPENPIPNNDLQYITDNIAPIFADLSSLQIFNVIVPTGCVGFLIYICLRRF